MKAIHFFTISALALTASTPPLLAHHSVAAQHDTSRTLAIQGAIGRIEWINPHAHFWVDAQGEDGAGLSWELELPCSNALLQENVHRDFLKQAIASPSKSGVPKVEPCWRTS
ncbi:MAG TPA: DUF6152 family protein [Bryobacteraceae bacterium]|jgi:hypothetical protein